MGDDSPDRQEPWRAALAVLLVAGAVVRVWAVLTVGDLPLVHGDEWQYVSAALSLSRGAGYPGSFRPPAYPLLLAAAFRLGGESLVAARLAQVPVGLVSIALVFDLARRRFGRNAAFMSALLVAVNPTLVHYTHFLWSETLVGALLLLLLWSLDRFELTRSARWLIASGAVLGVASLAREMLLYLLPITAAWLWCIPGERVARWRRVVVFAVPVLLVIAPWTARNFVVQGRFVLISTARWAPIAEGLLHDPAELKSGSELAKEFRRRLRRSGDDVEQEAFARRRAIELLAQGSPRWLAAKLWRGPYQLFSIESQMVRFARFGWFPPEVAHRVRVLMAIEAVYYVASTALGLAGLWLVPGGRVKQLVVATILFFLAVHTIAYSTHRYRLPLLPLLALYAGPLLCGRVAARPRRWRAFGAAASLLWFLAVASLSYGEPRVRDTFRHGPSAWRPVGEGLP